MSSFHRSPLPLLVCLGFLSTVGAGCSSHQRPTASVASVDRSGDRADATSYRVLITVQNENPTALPIEYVEYTLEVEGAGRYAGRWQPMSALYPNGESTVELPASVPGPLPAGSRAFSFDGRIFYESPRRFDRTLRDLGFWRPSATARGSGRTGN